jgi:formylglycine-generating enzyme required for sulfatase activity
MKIKADYLALQGYRLPSEAEWEYACRAGSTVGYSFGESAELLERYGWFDRNSLGMAYPVGTLKPNDLGLFDMHGNAWQWMQDVSDIKVDKDDVSGGLVVGASGRVSRGGGFGSVPNDCRAAFRNGSVPDYVDDNFGFRLARVAVETGSK